MLVILRIGKLDRKRNDRTRYMKGRREWHQEKLKFPQK